MFSAPIVAGAAFVLLSLYFLQRTIFVFREAERSNDWPQVTGTVLSSEAVQHNATSHHRHFRVKYQYAVGDQTYTSQRGAFYRLDSDVAKDMVAAHNQESRVSVFFDPEAPGQAVLVQGARAKKKFSDIILASIGVLFSVFVLVGALTGFLA